MIHAFAFLKSPFDSLYWYNSPRPKKQAGLWENHNSNSKIFTRPPPHLSDLFWILYTGATLPDLKTQAGVWEQLAIQNSKNTRLGIPQISFGFSILVQFSTTRKHKQVSEQNFTIQT